MKFIDRVMESSDRIWSRAVVFVLINFAIYGIYIGIIQHGLKEGVFIGLGLFIAFAALVCFIIVALIALAVIAVIINCFAWLFTGEWENGLVETILNFCTDAFKFIYLLFFGDWWLKKRKES